MSIIAISSVPPSWNVRQLVSNLAKCIRGHFEGLSIINEYRTRVGYIRLPANLDPSRVIQFINKHKFKIGKKQNIRLRAVVPNYIPDLPFSKPEPVSRTVQKKYKIAPQKSNAEIIVDTVTELLVELQSKYIGLCDLSQKTEHKLLNEIALTILDRLKTIFATEQDLLMNGFGLTKAYRKSHPHFADFQLILSTLHQIEDDAGTPRTQLLESELSDAPKELNAGANLSYEKINSICHQYAGKIHGKVQEYINTLREEVAIEPTNEEDIARKRVKEEFIKMSPYINDIIRQVLTPDFMPDVIKSSPTHRMRIYGEPFLPPKEELIPLMSSLRAIRVQRSDFIYNMLRFNISRNRYTSAMELDGTVVGTAKLVVRSSEMLIYKPPTELQDEMKALIEDF